MPNSSQVPVFILAAYVDAGTLKYLYFALLLCLYVVTVGANVLLLLVICANRSLHEPMYLFLCSLFVNEVYGSTGLLPFLLRHILSDTHTVPAALCFLQIFCVYSYGSVEFFSLAVMAYDRYLAVCWPLQYHARMTLSRVSGLLAGVWSLPILVNFCALSLLVPLRRCTNVINKVYCDNHSVVKLACQQASLNSIYGLLVSAAVVLAPLVLVLFTYMKILQVCLSASAEARQKAFSTCVPHLASLINFSFGACFEILQSRFDMSGVPHMLRVFLSLYFLVVPPIFNPLIYGLKLSRIRQAALKRLCCSRWLTHPPQLPVRGNKNQACFVMSRNHRASLLTV